MFALMVVYSLAMTLIAYKTIVHRYHWLSAQYARDARQQRILFRRWAGAWIVAVVIPIILQIKELSA